MCETLSPFSPSLPSSLPLGQLPDMTSGERVALIQERIRDVEKRWIELKNEVASLDRKRRRARRKEREGSVLSLSFEPPDSLLYLLPSSPYPTQFLCIHTTILFVQLPAVKPTSQLPRQTQTPTCSHPPLSVINCFYPSLLSPPQPHPKPMKFFSGIIFISCVISALFLPTCINVSPLLPLPLLPYVFILVS